jgi:lipoate-protein ligase A
MWIDDQILKRCSETLVVDCWIPSEQMVVLGAANLASMEVFEDTCAELGVSVLKRAGGGGTVVLYPGVVVVSVGCWVGQHFQNRLYFDRINQAMIACLQPLSKDVLEQRGISDLCIDQRKFCGTSMFRSKNYLLYQASVLAHCDFELFAKVLRHPSREPDYRKGRRHEDFLVGLCEMDPELKTARILSTLKKDLGHHLLDKLGDELIQSQPDQWAHLLNRGSGSV